MRKRDRVVEVTMATVTIFVLCAFVFKGYKAMAYHMPMGIENHTAWPTTNVMIGKHIFTYNPVEDVEVRAKVKLSSLGKKDFKLMITQKNLLDGNFEIGLGVDHKIDTSQRHMALYKQNRTVIETRYHF